MNKLDVLLLTPIAIGFIFGLYKGLIKELTSFAAILLGIWGAKLLSPFVCNLLEEMFYFSPKIALPLAYLCVFVLIVIGLLTLAKVFEKMVDSLSLGGLNKFFGGIFGALKYALLISVLLTLISAVDRQFQLINPSTKENSIVYKPLLEFAPALWDETKKEKKSDLIDGQSE